MKKTRLFLATSLLTIGAFSTVTMTSCEKDKVECNVGYEGEDCKTLSRDKFIGKWKGDEECTVGDDNYTIDIAVGSGGDLQLIYSNVYNDNYVATGTITGTNGFSFSGTAAGGVTFSGTASYESSTGRLVVNYKVLTGTVETNSCTFTGTKL